MSKLEKIVALADYIEEGRTFVGEEIRKLADEDLDKALYLSMIEITDYLANNNLPISSLTKRALEEYQQLYGGN
jgi:HD superfamily phosphohydrolase YqeK